MEYVLIGIAFIFVCFVVWAVVKGNDFKGKEKEKPAPAPAPAEPAKAEEFVLVKQEKPKKVKIKKKEEKVSGEPQIVRVFEKTESEQSKTQDSANEKDKEELYKRYIEKEGLKEKTSASEKQDNGERKNISPMPLTEEDIEKRIAEIRKNNYEATSKPSSESSGNKNDQYYGFGIGAGGHHNHGSLRDPNFDPWPDENKPKGKMGFPLASDFNDLDDDDDFIDMEAIDRLMSGSRPNPFADNPFPRRSGLGGGSVKSNLGKRKMTGEDIMIGSTIAGRKGATDPFGDIN